jgi:hypothetical protein
MGKSANKTTTEQSAPPSWATNLQLGGLSSAVSAISPYLTPGYGVAGTNPDQQAAYGMIRQNAAAAPPSVAWDPAQAAQIAAAPVAQAAQGTAAQLGGNEYRQFLNPYTRDVVGTTLSQMRDQQDQNMAAIQARQAAAHSFAGSGSRAALQSAQSTKDFNSQVASTVAQLMSAGYDKATANAMANAQMRQQTGLANTGYQQQANLANASMQQARDLAQAGYGQQANIFNATGVNNTAQQNAAQNIAYQQQALAQLLGIGQSQQQQAQAGLNMPLQASTALAGILPQGVGSNKTTVAPSNSPSTLQTILGLAGTVGGGVLGGPMGAGIGSALGTGIGSLFGPSQSDERNVGRTGFY